MMAARQMMRRRVQPCLSKCVRWRRTQAFALNADMLLEEQPPWSPTDLPPLRSRRGKLPACYWMSEQIDEAICRSLLQEGRTNLAQDEPARRLCAFDPGRSDLPRRLVDRFDARDLLICESNAHFDENWRSFAGRYHQATFFRAEIQRLFAPRSRIRRVAAKTELFAGKTEAGNKRPIVYCGVVAPGRQRKWLRTLVFNALHHLAGYDALSPFACGQVQFLTFLTASEYALATGWTDFDGEEVKLHKTAKFWGRQLSQFFHVTDVEGLEPQSSELFKCDDDQPINLGDHLTCKKHLADLESDAMYPVKIEQREQVTIDGQAVGGKAAMDGMDLLKFFFMHERVVAKNRGDTSIATALEEFANDIYSPVDELGDLNLAGKTVQDMRLDDYERLYARVMKPGKLLEYSPDSLPPSPMNGAQRSPLLDLEQFIDRAKTAYHH